MRLSRSFSCRVKDDSEGNEVTGGVKDEVLNVAWESRSSPVFLIRPHGQVVKTSPFHGGNPSSSLGGVTNF